MKAKGARFQYQDEFEADLYENYMRVRKEHLLKYGRINNYSLLLAVVSSPAKRFYASEEQTRCVIEGFLKGNLYPKMKPNTREMYLEIFARIKQQIRMNPNKSLDDIILEVLSQPAPKFYLTPRSAEVKLCHLKKRRK